MSIEVTIKGDSVASLGKLAAELASKLNGVVAAAPAPATATTAPAAKAAPAPAAKAAPAPAAKAEKAEKAKKEEPAAEDSDISIDTLRDLGKKCIKAGKNKEMRELLTELGSESITALDTDKYQECKDGLEKILGGEDGSDNL